MPESEQETPSETTPHVKARVPLAIEDWLTVIIMALLALITFANVLVRYFTDASFAWTEEISVFLMILLAMVGASSAVARNHHIRIEFFADGGSETRRRRLAIFAAAMVALLFIVIAVLSARVTFDDIRYGETSPGLGVPTWWYSIWLPLVSLAIVLRALGVILRRGEAVTGVTHLPGKRRHKQTPPGEPGE